MIDDVTPQRSPGAFPRVGRLGLRALERLARYGEATTPRRGAAGEGVDTPAQNADGLRRGDAGFRGPARETVPPWPPEWEIPEPGRPAPAHDPTGTEARSPGGPGALVVLGLLAVGAAGLLLMTGGNARNRMGEGWAQPLFWSGFLLIVVPPALVLVSWRPSRHTRVCILAGVGVLLYLSKVLHDPFAFTFSDELIHLANAEQILRDGALFPENPILPVSIYYPGLASLTAALSMSTGLSAYASGLIVIGAARVLFMLALFLLFERLSGSSALGSVAGLVYVASPNFLFWTAQFSYQSLALPLAALAVLAVVERGREADQRLRQAWVALFMVMALAIVMTHHLTGYALVGTLVVLSLAVLAGFGRRREAAWGLAAFTAAAAVIWLFQVAPVAGDYLGQIFRRSFGGVVGTVEGSGAARRPFQASGGTVAPAWERVVGYVSVALLAAALPPGLLRLWRRRRRSAFLAVSAVAAVTFIAIIPLRLVPSAWETANRASDFLFVGVALAIAMAALHLGQRGRVTPARRAGAGVFVGVVAMGGALAGWPPTVRLSLPYEARIGDRVVRSPSLAVADWARRDLPPRSRFVADDTSARSLLAYGDQLPFTGRVGLARYVLDSESVTPELVDALRRNRITYVAVDRRGVARDALQGLFLSPRASPREGRNGLQPPERVGNYDRPDTERLFDSGDLVVYDVSGMQP